MTSLNFFVFGNLEIGIVFFGKIRNRFASLTPLYKRGIWLSFNNKKGNLAQFWGMGKSLEFDILKFGIDKKLLVSFFWIIGLTN